MRKSYKFGAIKKREFLKLLQEGARRGAAAEAVGITRETVRQYMKEELDFAAAVDQAEMDAHELIEDALFLAAQSGNVVAGIFYLCNRMSEKWKNVQKVLNEHSGPGGGAISLQILTPEQEKARLAALMQEGSHSDGDG